MSEHDFDFGGPSTTGDGQTHEQQSQPQTGAGGFDEYFGGGGGDEQPQPQANTFHSGVSPDHFVTTSDHHDFGGEFNNQASQPIGFQSNGFQQQGFGQPQFGQAGFGQQEPVDPEEEERQRRLKKIEEERLQRIQERTLQERQLKDETRQKANADLQRWAADRNNTIKSRKELNKQLQEDALQARKPNQYKSPWEKVVANISIKDGDYPGKKDVKRMREAILNKRADLA